MSLGKIALAALGFAVLVVAGLGVSHYYSPQRKCTAEQTIANVRKTVPKMALRQVQEPAVRARAETMILVTELAYTRHDKQAKRVECSGVATFQEPGGPGQPPLVEPFVYSLQTRRQQTYLMVEFSDAAKYRLRDWAERVRVAAEPGPG